MRGRQDPQVSMLAFIDIESRIALDQGFELATMLAQTPPRLRRQVVIGHE